MSGNFYINIIGQLPLNLALWFSLQQWAPMVCFLTLRATQGKVTNFNIKNDFEIGNSRSKLLITNFWLALYDSIGYLLLPFFLDFLGRVRTHTWSFGLMGLCLIGSQFVGHIHIVKYILINFAKLVNAIAFGGIFNWTIELFPTHLS